MNIAGAPRVYRVMTRDLHEGFSDPRRVPAGDLERFLDHADRLPGVRAIQDALRRALHPRPGMRLLDAGCGIGLETTRIAAEHPSTYVLGLDRNAEMLGISSRGLRDDSAAPFSFDVSETVWRRIVSDTLTARRFPPRGDG
jgi:SAM-dependent methyltransferase